MGLGLHAFDPELHLAQLRVEPYFDLHQVSQFGLDGEMDPQVLDLEVDLLDAEGRHVELYVGFPRALPAVLPSVDSVTFVPAHAPVIFQCRGPSDAMRPSPTPRYSSVMPLPSGK